MDLSIPLAPPPPRPLLTPRLRLHRVGASDVTLSPQAWPAGQTTLWRIDSSAVPQVLGFAALRRRDAATVEPWIALLAPHRGHGHAQEALRALLWHALRASRATLRVVAVCDVPNTAADRLLRRLGFVAVLEADGVPWRWREYTLALAAD